MAEKDAKERAMAVCEICGEAFIVWVASDGTAWPVAGPNVCACEEPVPRILDEETEFED